MQTTIDNNRYKNISSKDKKAWYELVIAWEKSNESQSKFCHQRGLNKNTLSYWRGMYLAELKKKNKLSFSVNVPASTPKLLPVKVEPEALSSSKSLLTQSIRLQTPQGYVLTMPSDIDTTFLVELLQKLGGHHA